MLDRPMLGEEFQFGGCPNGLDRQPVGCWGELRELLRHPAVVKRLTAAGECVQVTDNGKPLWVLRSATVPSLADSDRQLVDDELDAMLAERRSAVSAGQLIVDSRTP